MLLNNLYSGICSNCHRPTLLDPIGYCENILNNGNTCNFVFPNDNTGFRRKMKEHTSLWSGRNVDHIPGSRERAFMSNACIR